VCGVQVIDTKARLRRMVPIDGAISEIYDVAVVPETACPMSLASPPMRSKADYAR